MWNRDSNLAKMEEGHQGPYVAEEDPLRSEWRNMVALSCHFGASPMCDKCATYRSDCECAFEEWKTERATQSGLERAPRATRQTWADELRKTYADYRKVDMADVIQKLEQAFLQRARGGDNSVVLDDRLIHKGVTADMLCEKLHAAHPQLTFTPHYLATIKAHAIEWK